MGHLLDGAQVTSSKSCSTCLLITWAAASVMRWCPPIDAWVSAAGSRGDSNRDRNTLGKHGFDRQNMTKPWMCNWCRLSLLDCCWLCVHMDGFTNQLIIGEGVLWSCRVMLDNTMAISNPYHSRGPGLFRFYYNRKHGFV